MLRSTSPDILRLKNYSYCPTILLKALRTAVFSLKTNHVKDSLIVSNDNDCSLCPSGTNSHDRQPLGLLLWRVAGHLGYNRENPSVHLRRSVQMVRQHSKCLLSHVSAAVSGPRDQDKQMEENQCGKGRTAEEHDSPEHHVVEKHEKCT